MPKGIWRPRAECLTRDEYLSRAYEFAHRTPVKLTASQVAAIRVRASMGVNYEKMASQYGVHRNTIARIATYESWAASV
jgi:predicted DNA-binding protein (UPF0251 family)